MRALVVEHDILSTPERVGEHLERRGVDIEPFVVVDDIDRPDVEATFPEDDEPDLVILMGAPWSAYDQRVQGWVRPEVRFVRNQLARGTPILGICFGAQITAIALGAEVTRSDMPEYGWSPIQSSSPAIGPGPWFHYHQDEFSLPAGASELARTASGLQAFTHGRSLAVQFHPEVTASLVSSWFAVGGDAQVRAAGLDPDELIEETAVLARETQPALERMIDWWLDDLAGGSD